MLVEFWDRTRLGEQEALIGRQKATGAPLDGEVETDIPDYAADPDGEITPLDAHIRLANPRTAEHRGRPHPARAGFSFSRGFDGNGQLDQGLAFVSFQRRMSQFLNTQERLAGEPLEEYIRPEGGGFFFALPGVTDGRRLPRRGPAGLSPTARIIPVRSGRSLVHCDHQRREVVQT